MPHCGHCGRDYRIAMSSNARWTAFDYTESRLGGRERYVEGRDRLAETFQGQAAEVFQRNRFFHCGCDAATYQYLPVLGLGAVNLTGMFYIGQAAARQMVKQGGGSIINVTSQLAEVARPERAAYIASKGGARSLTHAMAVDLAAHGIRVNAIAPGPTLTGLTRASYTDPEARRATEAMIPLGGAVSCLRRVALGNRQHGNSGRRLSGDMRRRE